MKKLTFLLILAAFFAGCSAKKSDEIYNLTPQQWYLQIMNDIKDANLKAADEHFTSFVSEHIASPMLEPMTLILAQAHIDEEDYAMANLFLDEYIRRYGTEEKIEYAKFLKIKANFDSFIRPNRNQKLVQSSINEIQSFISQYPYTKYRPLLETMLIKFRLAEHQLDKEIQSLYERTGRETSAEIYKQRVENSALNDANLVKPDAPWYRAIFE